MSRQSSYTQETADTICYRIMAGESLRRICSDDGMPDRASVYRWLAENEEFATKCARARMIQADLLEEQMADIEQETLDGSLNPNAAKVVLSSKQWRASKLAPKKYGDRLAVGGADDMPAINQSLTISFVTAKQE